MPSNNTKDTAIYPPHNPHDKTFKQLMGHPTIAKAMFLEHLPQKVLKVIDLNTISLCKSSYIDDRLKETAADVLYKVKTYNKTDGYLYCLCEHQSTPDKDMALRFLKYTCRIMEDHIKRGHKHLPMVVPILVFNGDKGPYPYSISLFDQFANKKLAKKIMFKSAQLIDLTAISDEQLLKRQQADVFLKMLLKHMRARDFLPYLEKLIPIMTYLRQHKKEAILKDIVGCVLITTQISDEERFINLVTTTSNNTGKHIMTLAQQLHARGIQEGIREGIREGIQEGTQEGMQVGQRKGALAMQRSMAENMIRKGMDKESVSEFSGLSAKQVNNLIEELTQKE